MPIKQEIYRKIFHLCMLLIPIFYVNLGKLEFLKAFIPISIAIIIVDVLRCKTVFFGRFVTKIFQKIMRDKELTEKKFSGVTWVFLGAMINFGIFHKPIAITGFCILIFSDACAAIVGKSIASRPFYEKSTAGSLAFFISAIFVILGCGLAFECNLSFYLFAIFIASFLTFLEAYPSFLGVDDNFLIPIVFGGCMSLFDLMWHIF